MKILLLADGGPGVGLGHATRCIALTSELLDLGHDAVIIVDIDSGLEDYVRSQGCSYLATETTPESMQYLSRKLDAKVIVIDSYRWATMDFSSLRGSACKVIAFDDKGTRLLPVDAVINGAISATEIGYQVPPGAKLFLGPEFQVIRNSFKKLPIRAEFGSSRRVIVLVGGDDPLGLLPFLANTLENFSIQFRPKLSLDIVCGPFAKTSGIKENQHLKILKNPKDLPERMALADFAVSASGQTLYELAKCGTPTIGFTTGQDQERNLRDLESVGFLISTGDARKPEWPRRLETALDLLANNVKLRIQMSNAGQKLIDGFGSTRLAKEISLLGAR